MTSPERIFELLKAFAGRFDKEKSNISDVNPNLVEIFAMRMVQMLREQNIHERRELINISSLKDEKSIWTELGIDIENYDARIVLIGGAYIEEQMLSEMLTNLLAGGFFLLDEHYEHFDQMPLQAGQYDNGILLVSGGTAYGVMSMLGGARILRQVLNNDLAIVGVMPHKYCENIDISHHLSFLITVASESQEKKKDESDWGIIAARTMISLGDIGVVVNGGFIAVEETAELIKQSLAGNSKNLVVVKGSGRWADVLANMLEDKIIDSNDLFLLRFRELVSEEMWQIFLQVSKVKVFDLKPFMDQARSTGEIDNQNILTALEVFVDRLRKVISGGNPTIPNSKTL